MWVCVQFLVNRIRGWPECDFKMIICEQEWGRELPVGCKRVFSQSDTRMVVIWAKAALQHSIDIETRAFEKSCDGTVLHKLGMKMKERRAETSSTDTCFFWCLNQQTKFQGFKHCFWYLRNRKHIRVRSQRRSWSSKLDSGVVGGFIPNVPKLEPSEFSTIKDLTGRTKACQEKKRGEAKYPMQGIF